VNNKQTTGIAVAVLGLLLTCCLCPLALNSLAVLGGGNNMYARFFSARAGRLIVSSYVVGAQNVCATVLALIVLVTGIVMLVQSRGNDSKSG
jgi:hypothetical protein